MVLPRSIWGLLLLFLLLATAARCQNGQVDDDNDSDDMNDGFDDDTDTVDVVDDVYFLSPGTAEVIAQLGPNVTAIPIVDRTNITGGNLTQGNATIIVVDDNDNDNDDDNDVDDNDNDSDGGKDTGPGCVCADVYAPVCGADGKTYGNACEAACAGVAVANKAAGCAGQTAAGP